MHPVLIIVPAVGLLVGPRLWVEHVRRRHRREEVPGGHTGGELARELLDSNDLTRVEVEHTDLGDHYDPRRRAVRLTRENHDQSNLAALVTAAHEVGHALQHATDYPPFRWRAGLVRVARVTAEIGGILLLAAPAAAIATRSPMPPIVIGTTAFAVLGTGFAAQLSALPTEWDASFGRALPLLEDGYIHGSQVEGAKEMLLACSLTYVASSLAAVLQFWPWLPRRPVMETALVSTGATAVRAHGDGGAGLAAPGAAAVSRARRASPQGAVRVLVRRFGKPLIRRWTLARRATTTGARGRPRAGPHLEPRAAH